MKGDYIVKAKNNIPYMRVPICILGAVLIVLSAILGANRHKRITPSAEGEYVCSILLPNDNSTDCTDRIMVSADGDARMERNFLYTNEADGKNMSVEISATGKMVERYSFYLLKFDSSDMKYLSAEPPHTTGIFGSQMSPRKFMDKKIRIPKAQLKAGKAMVSYSRKSGKEKKWVSVPIVIDNAFPQNVTDYVFSGYLTNGKNKYNIEMRLCFIDSYHFEGYYRYLSQPADRIIGVHGELSSSKGTFASSEYLSVFTDGGTERFDFEINGNVASGKWFKYDSADDRESKPSNYRESLALHLTKK